jgi:hypothetical protein
MLQLLADTYGTRSSVWDPVWLLILNDDNLRQGVYHDERPAFIRVRLQITEKQDLLFLVDGAGQNPDEWATLIDEFFQLFDDDFRVSTLEAVETARVDAEILATQEEADANGPGRPKGIFHYELPVINDGISHPQG